MSGLDLSQTLNLARGLLGNLIPWSWVLSLPPTLFLAGILTLPCSPLLCCQHFLWNLGQDHDLQSITLPARMAPGQTARAALSIAHSPPNVSPVFSNSSDHGAQGLEKSRFWQPVMSYRGRKQRFGTINHEPHIKEVVLFLNFSQAFFLCKFKSIFLGIDIHSNISSLYLVERAFENSTHVY